MNDDYDNAIDDALMLAALGNDRDPELMDFEIRPTRDNESAPPGKHRLAIIRPWSNQFEHVEFLTLMELADLGDRIRDYVEEQS